MIRWGYYKRKRLAESKEIRIQRIRCKKCGKTINVLPSFLLARKSHTVYAFRDLLYLFLNNEQEWKKLLDLSLDVRSAYRWLDRFKKQIIQTLPHIRKVLIQIKPSKFFIDETEGKPLSLTSTHTLFKRFLKITNTLLTEAVRLVDKESQQNSDMFCFLNLFFYNQTGKPLLIQ